MNKILTGIGNAVVYTFAGMMYTTSIILAAKTVTFVFDFIMTLMEVL